MLVRAGLQSAIETLRNSGGDDPVKAAFKIARTLEDMSAKRREKFEDEAGNLPPAEFDRLIATMKIAADIHIRLADFAFPRLGRIDVAGDAPPVPLQHKMVVRLRIGRPPGANGSIEHNADPLADDPTIRSDGGSGDRT